MASDPKTTPPRTLEELFASPEWQAALARVAEQARAVIDTAAAGLLKIGTEFNERMEARHGKR